METHTQNRSHANKGNFSVQCFLFVQIPTRSIFRIPLLSAAMMFSGHFIQRNTDTPK